MEALELTALGIAVMIVSWVATVNMGPAERRADGGSEGFASVRRTEDYAKLRMVSRQGALENMGEHFVRVRG